MTAPSTYGERMGYLLRDVITRARSLVQDREPPYRYEDNLYVSYIKDSFYCMRVKRPDLFIGVSEAVFDITLEDVGVRNTRFPLDAQYFVAVVKFVAGMIEQEDGVYQPEGKASHFMADFNLMMTKAP